MQKLVQKEITSITKITTSADSIKTFCITREIQGIDGKHAIFIMLYPTRNTGNCYIDDSTNTHLMNHMEELGLTSYTIVNLFATVTHSRLSLKGLVIDDENMLFLREQIFLKLKKNETNVVIAWGNSQQNSPIVCKSKLKILELWEETNPDGTLYQLTTEGMEKDNPGVHPLFLGIRHSNSIWKLKSYPHKKIKKELENRKNHQIKEAVSKRVGN